MEEIYSIDKLFTKRLCRIVFVEDRETAANLTAKITATHPEYACDIGEQLSDYKRVGPFKLQNKQSLWEIIQKTDLIRQLHKIDAEGARKLAEGDLAVIGLKEQKYRTPRSMSYLQKLCASVLRYIYDGKYHFVLNDSVWDDDAPNLSTRFHRKMEYYRIAKYIKQFNLYNYARCELIWITDFSVNDMLDLLGEDEYPTNFYGFYQIQDGCAVALNKINLIKTYESENGYSPTLFLREDGLDEID